MVELLLQEAESSLCYSCHFRLMHLVLDLVVCVAFWLYAGWCREDKFRRFHQVKHSQLPGLFCICRSEIRMGHVRNILWLFQFLQFFIFLSIRHGTAVKWNKTVFISFSNSFLWHFLNVRENNHTVKMFWYLNLGIYPWALNFHVTRPSKHQAKSSYEVGQPCSLIQ